jgi:hypothetical protein
MLLATFKFLTEQVVGDSYLELLSLAVLISAVATLYKHVECHQDGCHRLGRYTHGHLKLCAIHHPLVPNDGKVTTEHINAVTEAQQAKAAGPRPPGS